MNLKRFQGKQLLAATLIAVLTCGLITLGVSCTPPSPTPNDNEPGNTNDNEPGNTNDNEPGNTNDNEPGNTNDNEPGLVGKFVGADACLPCHSGVHDDWSQTLHAEALETLEASADAEDFCLACHTVGYGEEGGFTSREATPELVGVQCENCHGPAKDHVDNIGDASLRPPTDLGADVCGKCHTGDHHPTFEQWQESGHAAVTEIVALDLIEEGGFYTATCGVCHEGAINFSLAVKGEDVAEDLYVGSTEEDLTPITCVVCHDSHARTGNAYEPDTDRDYQLRFPQVKTPEVTSDAAVVTDVTRYNLCGQCHHSRGREWQTATRAPHHSVQSNFYFGEMAVPEGTDLLVETPTPHFHQTGVPGQCSECHMYRIEFQSDVAPAISGHLFSIDFESCARCHVSAANAETYLEDYKELIQGRLDSIAERLGDPATWEYEPTGGPEDQDSISDEIKQVRFLYHYILSDGSLGTHHPRYADAILEKAEEILDDLGL